KTATFILSGVEAMHMIKKRQIALQNHTLLHKV
ncbi:IS6 family transposase, partial [Bacillus mycoides]|nr:IS6 family transposase [Bacillus mycoides]